jgi:hypothetical protein
LAAVFAVVVLRAEVAATARPAVTGTFTEIPRELR